MISIKETITEIEGDLLEKHKGFKNFLVSYLFSPRFRVLLNHRLGKYFYNRDNFILRQIGKYYKVRLITKRNCDISYNAVIGKGLKMPHPIGVVIGEGVVIKENVTIFQQVTFGSHGRRGENFEYPIVESGVVIYAGAKIIGGITIGENVLIGANSVVNISVPPNSIAVGVPCKILTK